MDDETVERVALGLRAALSNHDGVTIDDTVVTVTAPLNIHALALSVARALFAGVVVAPSLTLDRLPTLH